MKRLLSILIVSLFASVTLPAVAADAPKAADATKAAPLQKPANVTAEAWNKMTDAEKAKAVEAAKSASGSGQATAKPAKKEKKGGC
ncbi:MAG TPA: hypothetical protein VMV45_09750 [Casimicrobiaceae bacterium]|nr:hypothetical protein [Casimicrobiaceae bacterium]